MIQDVQKIITTNFCVNPAKNTLSNYVVGKIAYSYAPSSFITSI